MILILLKPDKFSWGCLCTQKHFALLNFLNKLQIATVDYHPTLKFNKSYICLIFNKIQLPSNLYI